MGITETIETIWQLFINRSDRYLIHSDVWSWSDSRLTKEIMGQHLEGKIRIGVAEMDRQSQTKFVLLDVDRHKPEAAEKFDAVVNKLREKIMSGKKPLRDACRFVHTGGGVHVIIFFREKAPAESLKKYFLINLLDRCGFRIEGSMWFDGEVQMGEIFPRQNTISKDGYAVRIPLGLHKNGKWSKVMFDEDLESVIPIPLGKKLIGAFKSDSKTRMRGKRRFAVIHDWKPPTDKIPLPACVESLMHRKSVHEGTHMSNLDLSQAMLTHGYAIDDVHEVFSQMKGYHWAMTEYQTVYTIKRIQDGVLPSNSYKCSTYVNPTHGLECVEDCYRTEEAQRVEESTIPKLDDVFNPAKRTAIKVAIAMLEQGMSGSSISEVKGFAEVEGIHGVTKEIAAAVKSYIRRELNAQEAKPKEKKLTIATVITNMALNTDILFFRDELKKPYAELRVDGHWEIWPVRGEHFKELLIQSYRDMTGDVPNSNAVNDAAKALSAHAVQKGPIYPLRNRIVKFEGAIWYDMTNEEWEVLRIDEDGWEILPETPIPMFIRFDHQTSQVTPMKTYYGRRAARHRRAKLLKLMRFHNLADKKNRLLDIASLVFELVPDVPHPLTMPYGPAGSGKTLGFHKTRKLLTDPSVMDQGLPWPKKDGDVPIQFERHYSLIYSNLSYLTRGMSDHICRAIDGTYDEVRSHYKNKEMTVFKYTRCVGLNAIPIIITQEDLLDRSLLFKHDAIAAEKRMDEEELNRAFKMLRPVIFGAILDTLSAAMKIRPTIDLPYIERLGAFTKWGCAIAEVLGYEHKEFLVAYAMNRKTANKEFIEANMLARVTVEFMEETLSWSGTPKSLYDALVEFKWGNKELPKSWPRDEIEMSKRYTRIEEPLYRFGLDFERGRKTKRDITLTWRDEYGPKEVQDTFATEEGADEERESGTEERSDNDVIHALDVSEMIKDTSIPLDEALQSGQSVHLPSTREEDNFKKREERNVGNMKITDCPDCRNISKSIDNDLDKEAESQNDSSEDIQKTSRPERNPRTAKKFAELLSKFSSYGAVGLRDSDLRKILDEGYLDVIEPFVRLDWLKQHEGTLVWRVTEDGYAALKGKITESNESEE